MEIAGMVQWEKWRGKCPWLHMGCCLGDDWMTCSKDNCAPYFWAHAWWNEGESSNADSK
jgi:hypothetical protein